MFSELPLEFKLEHAGIEFGGRIFFGIIRGARTFFRLKKRAKISDFFPQTWTIYPINLFDLVTSKCKPELDYFTILSPEL